MDAEDYTVGAVAELTGVSMRSLRHYDEIGLLRPSRRSAAGYRLYSPDDLRRLQRIAFYRELGFGLDVIAAILADPQLEDEDHLERQRQLLSGQIARCQAMLAAVDKELTARRLGMFLTPQERLVCGRPRGRKTKLRGPASNASSPQVPVTVPSST